MLDDCHEEARKHVEGSQYLNVMQWFIMHSTRSRTQAGTFFENVFNLKKKECSNLKCGVSKMLQD